MSAPFCATRKENFTAKAETSLGTAFVPTSFFEGSERESMNKTDQQIESSFQIFCARHPEFAGDEATMRAMHAVIESDGLDVRIPEHLSLAFLKVRPATAPAPQPAPVSEPADALTQTARQLIASCGGEYAGRKLIRDLTADEYRRRSSDPVFLRADEILNPRTSTPLLTRGDHVVAQGRREREHTATLTHEIVESVERSKREAASGYAGFREKVLSPDAGGVPNPTGLSFGDRRAAANTPRRKMLSKEELEKNERENAARTPQPEKSRGDAIREEQLKRGRAHQERWSR